MGLYIGDRIANLRKERGMTQEQLAQELGISAPAVSKWETDTSYPDITLLCPLARVLGTNVDTLLEYEETLSGEKINEYTEQIIRVKQEEGIEKAEEALYKLLRQYPNSIALKFSAVAVFTLFEAGNPQTDIADSKRWAKEKKSLLSRIYESGDLEYRQAAIAMLASLELQDDNLDKAKAYLDELPELSNDTASDATGLWVRLYSKKGETEMVTQTLQRRLFFLANQMISCLTMMIEQTETDDKMLELCSVYQKLDEIVYSGGGESNLILATVYAKMGREEEAAAYLISYLENHAGNLSTPNPLLFAPTIRIAGKEGISDKERISTKEIKDMLLSSIKTDPFCAKLCERKDVQDVIAKWQ